MKDPSVEKIDKAIKELIDRIEMCREVVDDTSKLAKKSTSTPEIKIYIQRDLICQRDIHHCEILITKLLKLRREIMSSNSK